MGKKKEKKLCFQVMMLIAADKDRKMFKLTLIAGFNSMLHLSVILMSFFVFFYPALKALLAFTLTV